MLRVHVARSAKTKRVSGTTHLEAKTRFVNSRYQVQDVHYHLRGDASYVMFRFQAIAGTFSNVTYHRLTIGNSNYLMVLFLAKNSSNTLLKFTFVPRVMIL